MVLVVDDQPGVRLLFKTVFKEAGYEVITAGNGLDAVRQVEKKAPPLVLMDVRMPGMDGFAAMVRMLKIDPGIQVILMTAYTDESLLQRAITHGAVDCLVKPLDVYRLVEQVNAIWHMLEQKGDGDPELDWQLCTS